MLVVFCESIARKFCRGQVVHHERGGSKIFGAAGNEKPLQSVCKGFVFGLQSDCKLSIAGGVFAVVGGGERVVRVGGELYHCQICDVYEVLSIVVCSI